MKKLKNKNKNKKIFGHITFFILFLTVLFCGLSVINAVTINDTTISEIAQGITNAGDNGALILEKGTYNKLNQDINININNIIINAQRNTGIFTISNNVKATFINITFINGYKNGNGGAIFNQYVNTIMTFINCTFINNSGAKGGAIYNNAGANFTVANSTFTDNNSTISSVGAIYQYFGHNLIILNSTFLGNNALYGVVTFNSSDNFTVRNSTLTNNNTSIGGAIFNMAT